jgi:hypothetical protein
MAVSTVCTALRLVLINCCLRVFHVLSHRKRVPDRSQPEVPGLWLAGSGLVNFPREIFFHDRPNFFLSLAPKSPGKVSPVTSREILTVRRTLPAKDQKLWSQRRSSRHAKPRRKLDPSECHNWLISKNVCPLPPSGFALLWWWYRRVSWMTSLRTMKSSIYHLSGLILQNHTFSF